MIPTTASPIAPVDVRGGPGLRVERVGTSTIVSLSDVVLTTAGSGPNFTVASPDGKIRLYDGLSLLLRMDRAGPNAPTLSVDGSPRAQWRDANGSPLADGALQPDSLQRVVYDAARGIWLGTQLGGPGTTGVTPDFTGTLAQRGAYDAQPQGKTFLAISDLPTGPEWTLYIKRSNTFGDWSTGLAIKASPAQTTVAAQTAADLAEQRQIAAAEQAAIAGAQAQSAAGQAGIALTHAGVAATQAGISTAGAANAAAALAETRLLAGLVGALNYDMGTLDQPSDGSGNFDFGSL